MRATNRLSWVGLGAALVAAASGCKLGASEVKPAALSEKKEAPPPVELARPDDVQIQRRINLIFAQIDGLQEVRATSREGVVHLVGMVDTISHENQAISLAERVEGVVFVKSAVKQKTDLGDSLAPFGRALSNLWHATLDFLPKLAIAIVVFIPFLLGAHALRYWRRPFHSLGVSRLTGSLIRLALSVTLVIAGILIGLQILGIMAVAGAVIGTLGLVGLLLGLAFKDWVANYLPGMLLGLRPPFSAGDLVNVGDHEGRVLRITPRATVLMTTDGEELRIPNTSLLKETMINFSHHRKRRLRTKVYLGTDADVLQAQDIGRRALLELRGILPDPPPFLRAQELHRDGIEVEYLAWVDQDAVNFRNVESRAKRVVLEALHREGVPLALPSLFIHLPGEAPAVERAPATGPEDDAEERDEAFLDREWARFRSISDERDLLEEGRAERRRKRGKKGKPQPPPTATKRR